MTQISATISSETRDRLERYVRARGLKKGFVIEQALLHHLQAITELPEEILIPPPRLIVTSDSGQRILERLDARERLNQAMQALFDETPDPTPGDSA